MKRSWLFAGMVAILLPIAILAPLQARDKVEERPSREPDVIYVPTPNEVVDKMFELADIRKGEIVYDLGCGDGRIPVRAAQKFGVRSFGWDINPVRVKESLENVQKNNVQQLVTIKQGDIFELDLS